MRGRRIQGAFLAVIAGVASLVAVQPAALGAGSNPTAPARSAMNVRPDTPGDELWAARGPGGVPAALGVSPDGSTVFATGRSPACLRSPCQSDYATVAYDASTGSPLWSRRYMGHSAAATALGVSPDGSMVFVTGTSEFPQDYATVAYDASTGDRLWARRYNGMTGRDGAEFANAIAVSPDGSTVFVTGGSIKSFTSGSYDFATVAYEATTGARLWVRRYNGPHGSWDEARAMGVSPDGSAVFVTGSSRAPDWDYATVAYDPVTGAPLWTRRFSGDVGYNDEPTALGVSPDGSRVFVTGYSIGATSNPDYFTIAYDASTGTELWGQRFMGPGFDIESPTALGVSPDGSSVFVTGSTFLGPVGSEYYNYATLAYDASTGAPLWTRFYNGPDPSLSDDRATALGVSPDGSTVFVTGRSDGSGSDYDYATVAYVASTGAQLWERRYNGPGNKWDRAIALGVSPDGSTVFVTGDSIGSAGGFEFATLAYSTS